jgi:hypothetical protein
MKANRSIGCNVTECRFHAKSEPMCSLESIQVSRNGKPNAQDERNKTARPVDTGLLYK